MSWETTVLTWSNWSLTYGEIIAYSDKIAVVARLVIVIVLTLAIFIFRKKKKGTLNWDPKSRMEIILLFLIEKVVSNYFIY